MKILYGTTNKAKLQAMKLAVETLDIELIGLNDLGVKDVSTSVDDGVRKFFSEIL